MRGIPASKRLHLSKKTSEENGVRVPGTHLITHPPLHCWHQSRERSEDWDLRGGFLYAGTQRNFGAPGPPIFLCLDQCFSRPCQTFMLRFIAVLKLHLWSSSSKTKVMPGGPHSVSVTGPQHWEGTSALTNPHSPHLSAHPPSVPHSVRDRVSLLKLRSVLECF